MRTSLFDHCTQQGDPTLLRQWDPIQNGPLTPRDLSFGSHQKVWWTCDKGHHWQAAVKSRVSGAGCPVCAGRVVSPGENDLASTYPSLLREWDFSQNGTLDPQTLPPGSRKKVWWTCGKGHHWRAAIASRVHGAGCPVCAGRVIAPGENDLASTYPSIAQEWDFVKNAPLTPETCAPASNRRVWWLCPLGHSYQAAVGARTVNGSDCPYCAGRKVLPGFNDLETLEPQAAADWHPDLNGALTPSMVTAGSHRKVWWLCPEGHVWKAVVYSRTGAQKCGCPVCAGRRQAPRQQRYAALAERSPSTAKAVLENTSLGGKRI